jgi:hypothetical protein
MAISTFAELKTALASWLHRTGLTSHIPDFIMLAEEAMSRDLADCPALWVTEGGIALSGGSNTISLPAEAIGLRTLRIAAPYDEPLELLPAAHLVRKTGMDSTSSGRPQCAAVTGFSGATITVTLYPTADQAYTLEAVYPSTLTALSDAAPTNFVLARAPSAYLFGALREAAPYIANDARIPVWEGKYQRAIDSLKSMPWEGQMYLSTELAGLGGSAYDITRG